MSHLSPAPVIEDPSFEELIDPSAVVENLGGGMCLGGRPRLAS